MPKFYTIYGIILIVMHSDSQDQRSSNEQSPMVYFLLGGGFSSEYHQRNRLTMINSHDDSLTKQLGIRFYGMASTVILNHAIKSKLRGYSYTPHR